MALWTPYADDIALDLSKTKNEENPAESPNYADTTSPSYRVPESPIYPIPEYPNYTVSEYASYPVHEYSSYPVYPHFGYTPMPQASPLSAASISSYETQTQPPTECCTSLQPRTPLSPPISPNSLKRRHSTDDSLSDDPDFQAFEQDALRAMAEKNGGALLANNPRMRRSVQSSNETNNDSYRKQRERNNFAAKQSRDRRKLREIHLALKVTYLKKEVAALKSLLASRACSRCQESCRC